MILDIIFKIVSSERSISFSYESSSNGWNWLLYVGKQSFILGINRSKARRLQPLSSWTDHRWKEIVYLWDSISIPAIWVQRTNHCSPNSPFSISLIWFWSIKKAENTLNNRRCFYGGQNTGSTEYTFKQQAILSTLHKISLGDWSWFRSRWRYRTLSIAWPRTGSGWRPMSSTTTLSSYLGAWSRGWGRISSSPAVPTIRSRWWARRRARARSRSWSWTRCWSFTLLTDFDPLTIQFCITKFSYRTFHFLLICKWRNAITTSIHVCMHNHSSNTEKILQILPANGSGNVRKLHSKLSSMMSIKSLWIKYNLQLIAYYTVHQTFRRDFL